ncbi:hypothetical protein GCM10007973_23170 [Polymorphobacter multimanifer]|uniref:DUF3224 domain-containing protein n=1 Tax=Polymorphobacter multimanifer TaxID=1070431 RepID=A0A841L7D2_9SPHN|nr:DUF3224 domain-containing protein [Polymorphobacter multimanifer]MBB6228899.1 hypothetical protein [Polymorphobacter multimanifer]GGI85944.1 hypothetical protein GCM10007973_23170 [Polymorphobacter multimanifer]
MKNILWAAALFIGSEAMAAEFVAQGSFTVKMAPEAEAKGEGLTQGRIAVTKDFSGSLVGKGSGTMLSGITPEQGSAAYVLIERVEGTLDGRAGSFALAHLGLMDKGAPDLRVAIVPGSGTGDLAGIRGAMTLDVGGGRHDYILRYSLEAN